ncbi:MAG: multicopper oxidase domain-containing protein [Candidatus Nanopelagicales bacterium]
MSATRNLLVLGTGLAVVAAMSGCSTGSSPGPGPTSPTASATCSNPAVPSTLPAPVASLAASTTTADGGPVVDTSFPTVQGLPYADVPVIASKDGVLSTKFDTTNATYPVGGRPITGMTYAGQFMGPTLSVQPGDTIKIDFTNSLDETTNFHTHGLHTSPVTLSDNIFRVFASDSTNQVEIKVPEKIAPGTYWYHAHLHGFTEAQVFSGLSGALLVGGLTERLPKELQSAPDHLIAIKDVQLSDSTIQTDNIDSNAPTTRLVNSQVNPVISGQPGCTQLLRLGNFSADIWYKLKLDGAKFHVLTEDSNLVTSVKAVGELVFPPGKRYDVLVRWDDAGTYRLKTMPYSTGPQGDDYPERVLATFKVAGDTVAPVPMPTTLGDIPADQLPTMQDDTIAARHTWVFSEDNKAGKFFINGKQFDSTAPNVVTKLGTTEEWTLKNTSKEAHPFHIHVNDFQVMSINGKPVDALSLQDIVPLEPGGTVVIRMRFLDFVGKYVFHCHILAHEDNGMMAVVEVTKDGKRASAAQEKAWDQPSEAMPAMSGM